MIIPVILAGGSGTRLWPVSRKSYPKQFINLVDDQLSLFQQTVLRVKDTLTDQPPIILCNEEHRFLVSEQLRAINIENASVILEPVGRNTAPAIGVAAHYAMVHRDKDAQILVLPSDHAIADEGGFVKRVQLASEVSSKGYLVTFGIKVVKPETGYGYIKQGARCDDQKSVADIDAAHCIEKFVEKPDLSTAQRYMDSGEYYWNSGMFLFGASAYLSELLEHAADIHVGVNLAFEGIEKDLDFIRLPEQVFADIRSESIDYAVMENTRNAAVMSLDVGWNDLGVWSSLTEITSADENNNIISGDVLTSETHNSLIRAESRLVATVGIDDVIVIETADAVLVADKSRSQEIKAIVNKLNSDERPEAEIHQKVYRPWGWYETICLSERFQVKRIQVKPGLSLSLQKHHHRAEHWVVVRGTATITRGETVQTYTEDQSTYIPLGEVHRLANPGVIPLEIIEVQTGSYLGEDDIVRFEDNFGR
ncbi:MAG: mannose-1-phosphate guanylyltransferase/mannose-6-phosphate isomerase [Pseudomonadales bacterium]|nr:mannose-1-phosphate guanylyltransferase/mannose-6-phosphate isomerase [Pseudomonadales bacterium]